MKKEKLRAQGMSYEMCEGKGEVIGVDANGAQTRGSNLDKLKN